MWHYKIFRSLIRKIDVIPASRLASLDFCLERGSGDASECPSSSSTPLPCPKSKSTSSLSEEASSIISSASSSSGVGGSGSLDRSLSIAPPASYHHFTLSRWGPGGTTSSPCGGFSTQYAWMCDLHNLPYREEVAWVGSILSSFFFVFSRSFPAQGILFFGLVTKMLEEWVCAPVT